MKRQITLHIGFPKTGTTSIQGGLNKARQSLFDTGICFPLSPGKTNHYYLEAYAMGFERNLPTHTLLGIRSDGDLENFRSDFEARLRQEIEALPDYVSALLFSNEGLAGLSSEEEFTRLFDLLGKLGEVSKVIAYIRRQDLNAVSNYTTYLKNGGTRKNVLQKYRQGNTAYIFYGNKLRNWAKKIGVEKVDVRFFSRNEMTEGDLFSDFAAASGIPNGIDIRSVERSNPSISQAACVFLRCFNKQFPRFVDGAMNPLRSTVRETLEKNFPGKGMLPTRAEVLEYMEQFEESNEYIRQTWFPDRKKLFSEDYSMYPEEPVPVMIEEVMQVSNAVWEQRLSSIEK